MSNEPQLYRVNTESRESERIDEVNFDQLGLKERRDIQEWVATNPRILGEDLLIVGKEFSGFDLTNERLDLLAVDSDGKLVIIELKRDDSGTDAHWQAIKYASYLRRATHENIVDMLADYASISADDAGTRLLQHLGADDFNALNNDQRIILASHRFAPEVTSASLWINEKASRENLITCVTLTPYRDANTGSLYIQATTIIPVPGIDNYVVSIGTNAQLTATRAGNSFAANLKKAYERNKNDEVTYFARKVRDLAMNGLPDETRPDMWSRWAGGTHGRYYHLWYSRERWGNWDMAYEVNLFPQDESNSWLAKVDFRHRNVPEMKANLAGVSLHDQQEFYKDGIGVVVERDTLNDDFASRIAEMLREFIKQITPIVDKYDIESESTKDLTKTGA